jgi:hypothetical protein
MDRVQFVRRLKIAWTTTLSTFCVLMLLLWGRSYYRFDWWGPGLTLAQRGQVYHPTSGFLFESAHGAVVLQYVGNLSQHAWYAWSCGSAPADRSNLRVTGDDGESASDGFRAKTYPGGSFRGSAPHWCLALVAGVLVGSVWIRRFSIRTLLIATALLAAVLGLAKLAQSIDWGKPRYPEHIMDLNR